jgi:Protein of unknown function (DUF3795)
MDKKADLVAPCGMNCGICSGYLAATHDIKKQGIRMTYCRGCRPRNKNCAFLKKRCRLLSEGGVNFCSGCPDFPCDPLTSIDKRYRERYRMSMIENLAFIRDHGIDAFLKKEEEKWRCPGCGGTICCHNGICFDCGAGQLRNKKALYRWEENPPEDVRDESGTGGNKKILP